MLFRLQQLTDEALANRVQERTDEYGVKWFEDKLGVQPPFVKLVPLLEIIAGAIGSSVISQKSQKLFAELCSHVGDELYILLKAPMQDVVRVAHSAGSGQAGENVAEALKQMRSGNVVISPGYDGVYGKVSFSA